LDDQHVIVVTDTLTFKKPTETNNYSIVLATVMVYILDSTRSILKKKTF